ncbi:hypothetical protein MXF26_01430 [Pantoea dispersa]|nr:hypothetical protein [Pantoea dispersa]MEB5834918.1 hypothetical protein [Pantoea dispersa]QZY89440.1 hypothetical protein K7H94_13525 [Pantoea dispersa]
MTKIAPGFNLANASGGPPGTFIGQNLGWRATFVAIVIVALISTALIAAFMPAKLPQAEQSKPGAMHRELSAPGNPTLIFAVITTVLAQGGGIYGFDIRCATLNLCRRAFSHWL